MALNPTEVLHPHTGLVRVWKWTLTDGETGGPIVHPEKADVSIQAYGTWGGATLTIEGNLIPDATIDQWFAAKNPLGVAISLTSDGGDVILPNYYRMRPVVTGGSSSSINIYFLVK